MIFFILHKNALFLSKSNIMLCNYVHSRKFFTLKINSALTTLPTFLPYQPLKPGLLPPYQPLKPGLPPDPALHPTRPAWPSHPTLLVTLPCLPTLPCVSSLPACLPARSRQAKHCHKHCRELVLSLSSCKGCMCKVQVKV